MSGTHRVPIVQVQSVSYHYGSTGDGAGRAISDVTLEIGHGELIALVGQNGSGKSTLARHVNGLLKPCSGRVLVHGVDKREVPIHRLARYVGYAFQNPDDQLFAATVVEDISFGPRNVGHDPAEVERRAGMVIEQLGLGGVAGHHPFLLNRSTRRLVALAGVLALTPDVLVVDEPTDGLDAWAVDRVQAVVRHHVADGGAVLLISHDMGFVAATANRVVILRGGRVVADGPTRTVMTDLSLLTANNLALPPVTRLAQALVPRGMRPGVLNPEEFCDAYAALWRARHLLPGTSGP